MVENSQQLLDWVIASGGWIVAIFALWIGYKERVQFRREERLQETLQYFTGGTQKRSVGIALIEGVWNLHPEQMKVLIPVVSNQIVYLLLTTDSKNEAHEERNLVRLVSLMSSYISETKDSGSYVYDVLDAIARKLEGERKGLAVAPATLNLWRMKLDPNAIATDGSSAAQQVPVLPVDREKKPEA